MDGRDDIKAFSPAAVNLLFVSDKSSPSALRSGDDLEGTGPYIVLRLTVEILDVIPVCKRLFVYLRSLDRSFVFCESKMMHDFKVGYEYGGG